MSPTTKSALAARTREDRITEGLHGLADLIATGLLPEPHWPDQAVRISLSVPNAAEVGAVRDLFPGSTAVVSKDEHGCVHTSVEIPFGEGSDPGNAMPAYSGAVVLRVYHICEPS